MLTHMKQATAISLLGKVSRGKFFTNRNSKGGTMKKATKPMSQDPTRLSRPSLRDLSDGPSEWTCRYRAERKLWISQKVGQCAAEENQQGRHG